MELDKCEMYAALLAKLKQPSTGIDAAKFCGMIKTATDAMGQLLDRACTNFPEFTLHDRDHALRVINLMWQLCDKETRSTLSPIDLALLILSAFGHDVGMAVDVSRRKEIETSSEYKQYLADNEQSVQACDKARAAGNSDDAAKIATSLFRNYLRLHHHEESKRIINLKQHAGGLYEKLDYDGTSIADPVGFLCWSHGVPLQSVQGSSRRVFPFLSKYNSDLVFLACVLRMADYLEMDPSRAPASLMAFIDVSDPTSRKEWVKHQCQTFSVGSEEITISAKFDDFSKEKAYRDTLKGLDQERQEVMAYLTSQASYPKPPTLHLHRPIDTRPIESVGYIYKEFKFQLEYRQILALLMGTRLYRDERVFVRELIQNALDASRHASAREDGDVLGLPSRPRTITIRRSATDPRILEVEDRGAGMTMEIIEKYFMRVGKSYYGSSDFRQANVKFRPVSQFGIGILSCFMKADRIEVETRASQLVHPKADSDSLLGLQIDIRGLHENFVVRPYAKASPGTLVRVYLREPLTESLESLVTTYLARCPFPVEIVDGDRTTMLPPASWSVEGEKFSGMFLSTPEAFGYSSRLLELEGPFGFGVKGSMRFYVFQQNGRSALHLNDAGPYKVVRFGDKGETIVVEKGFDGSAKERLAQAVSEIRMTATSISNNLRPLVEDFAKYSQELLGSLTERRSAHRTDALWDSVRSQTKLMLTNPSASGHMRLGVLRDQLNDVVRFFDSFIAGELQKWPPNGICTQDGIDLTARIDLPGMLRLGVAFVYNLDFAGDHRFTLNVARDDVVRDERSEEVVAYLHRRIGTFLGDWFRSEAIDKDQVAELSSRCTARLGTAIQVAFDGTKA